MGAVYEGVERMSGRAIPLLIRIEEGWLRHPEKDAKSPQRKQAVCPSERQRQRRCGPSRRDIERREM